MVMNEVNGIQDRLRSSAASSATVHNRASPCKCDFYGGERTSGLGMSSACGERPAPNLLAGAA